MSSESVSLVRSQNAQRSLVVLEAPCRLFLLFFLVLVFFGISVYLRGISLFFNLNLDLLVFGIFVLYIYWTE